MLKKAFLKIFNLFFSFQFLKFLTVGGIAALANFVSGDVFRDYFPGKFYYTISIVFGFVIGSIISFILNKVITFKAHDERIINQLVKFCIPAIIGTFLASAFANIFMTIYNLLDIPWITNSQMETIARLMSIGATTLFNFPAMKFFSFKRLSLGNAGHRIK